MHGCYLTESIFSMTNMIQTPRNPMKYEVAFLNILKFMVYNNDSPNRSEWFGAFRAIPATNLDSSALRIGTPNEGEEKKEKERKRERRREKDGTTPPEGRQ